MDFDVTGRDLTTFELIMIIVFVTVLFVIVVHVVGGTFGGVCGQLWGG